MDNFSNQIKKYIDIARRKNRLFLSLSILGIILFLSLSFTLPFKDQLLSRLYPKPQSQASSDQGQKFDFQFTSNEVLIIFKKEIEDKVKIQNGKKTGIESVDSILKNYQVKQVEIVADKGSKNDNYKELFQLFLITLEGEKKITNGTANVKTQTITTQIDEEQKILKLVEELSNDPNIEAAELNLILKRLGLPNDPHLGGQWGIQKINAPAAWDKTTGSDSIVVAVLDTGIDRNHPDLKDNMWVNINDPIDGVDNDGNGYTDDHYGWDFGENDNDPSDTDGHGTRVAGVIGAVGNNAIGIAGVNWKIKIMAMRDDPLEIINLVQMMRYATRNKAKVINLSIGEPILLKSLWRVQQRAVDEAKANGAVVVTGSGNFRQSSVGADSLNMTPAFADDVITVTATGPGDKTALDLSGNPFSGMGEKLDVAAPGERILSTWFSNPPPGVDPYCNTRAGTLYDNIYCFAYGTSYSTPFVSGLAALILSVNPSLYPEQVRQIIRTSAVDLDPPGKDREFGYGRIDAKAALDLAETDILAPEIMSPSTKSLIYGHQPIFGRIIGSNFKSYSIDWSMGRNPAVWSTLVEDVTERPIGFGFNFYTLQTEFFPETGAPDGYGSFYPRINLRIRAKDTSDKVYEYTVYDIKIDNVPDTLISILPSTLTLFTDNPSPKTGENINLFGLLTDKDKLTVSGKEIKLIDAQSGSLVGTGTTNNEGIFSIGYSISSNPKTFYAKFEGDGENPASQSMSLTIIASSSTSVSLTADNQTPKIGSNIIFSGSLKDKKGEGISGKTIRLFEAVTGAEIASASTDPSGNYKITYTVSSPNQLVIYAKYQGDSANPLTISSSVTITPLP